MFPTTVGIRAFFKVFFIYGMGNYGGHCFGIATPAAPQSRQLHDTVPGTRFSSGQDRLQNRLVDQGEKHPTVKWRKTPGTLQADGKT